MNSGDVAALASKLFSAKQRVYRRSLLELARYLGYDVKRPDLAPAVTQGLRAESRDHAQRIADTYNRDLLDAAEGRNDGELRSWAVARQRARAKPTAITEAYSAHADATIAAIMDLGLFEDATFDFGGHPELGDAPPACSICEAIIRGNPWTAADVVRLGSPHPACRQDWHLNTIDQRALPPAHELSLGQTLAGIVGGQPLIIRSGGRQQATEAVEQMRE